MPALGQQDDMRIIPIQYNEEEPSLSGENQKEMDEPNQQQIPPADEQKLNQQEPSAGEPEKTESSEEQQKLWEYWLHRVESSPRNISNH